MAGSASVDKQPDAAAGPATVAASATDDVSVGLSDGVRWCLPAPSSAPRARGVAEDLCVVFDLAAFDESSDDDTPWLPVITRVNGPKPPHRSVADAVAAVAAAKPPNTAVTPARAEPTTDCQIHDASPKPALHAASAAVQSPKTDATKRATQHAAESDRLAPSQQPSTATLQPTATPAHISASDTRAKQPDKRARDAENPATVADAMDVAAAAANGLAAPIEQPLSTQGGAPERRTRAPQWSVEEDADLQRIAAQTVPFSWRYAANAMRERGHVRSLDSCKKRLSRLRIAAAANGAAVSFPAGDDASGRPQARSQSPRRSNEPRRSVSPSAPDASLSPQPAQLAETPEKAKITQPTQPTQPSVSTPTTPPTPTTAPQLSNAKLPQPTPSEPQPEPTELQPSEQQPPKPQLMESRPSTSHSSASQPSTPKPSAAQPPPAQPPAAQPPAAQPSAAQPSAAQPSAAQPSAAQPSEPQPSVPQPPEPHPCEPQQQSSQPQQPSKRVPLHERHLCNTAGKDRWTGSEDVALFAIAHSLAAVGRPRSQRPDDLQAGGGNLPLRWEDVSKEMFRRGFPRSADACRKRKLKHAQWNADGWLISPLDGRRKLIMAPPHQLLGNQTAHTTSNGPRRSTRNSRHTVKFEPTITRHPKRRARRADMTDVDESEGEDGGEGEGDDEGDGESDGESDGLYVHDEEFDDDANDDDDDDIPLVHLGLRQGSFRSERRSGSRRRSGHIKACDESPEADADNLVQDDETAPDRPPTPGFQPGELTHTAHSPPLTSPQPLPEAAAQAAPPCNDSTAMAPLQPPAIVPIVDLEYIPAHPAEKEDEELTSNNPTLEEDEELKSNSDADDKPGDSSNAVVLESTRMEIADLSCDGGGRADVSPAAAPRVPNDDEDNDQLQADDNDVVCMDVEPLDGGGKKVQRVHIKDEVVLQRTSPSHIGWMSNDEPEDGSAENDIDNVPFELSEARLPPSDEVPKEIVTTTDDSSTPVQDAAATAGDEQPVSDDHPASAEVSTDVDPNVEQEAAVKHEVQSNKPEVDPKTQQVAVDMDEVEPNEPKEDPPYEQDAMVITDAEPDEPEAYPPCEQDAMVLTDAEPNEPEDDPPCEPDTMVLTDAEPNEPEDDPPCEQDATVMTRTGPKEPGDRPNVVEDAVVRHETEPDEREDGPNDEEDAVLVHETKPNEPEDGLNIREDAMAMYETEPIDAAKRSNVEQDTAVFCETKRNALEGGGNVDPDAMELYETEPNEADVDFTQHVEIIIPIGGLPCDHEQAHENDHGVPASGTDADQRASNFGTGETVQAVAAPAAEGTRICERKKPSDPKEQSGLQEQTQEDVIDSVDDPHVLVEEKEPLGSPLRDDEHGSEKDVSLDSANPPSPVETVNGQVGSTPHTSVKYAEGATGAPEKCAESQEQQEVCDTDSPIEHPEEETDSQGATPEDQTNIASADITGEKPTQKSSICTETKASEDNKQVLLRKLSDDATIDSDKSAVPSNPNSPPSDQGPKSTTSAESHSSDPPPQLQTTEDPDATVPALSSDEHDWARSPSIDGALAADAPEKPNTPENRTVQNEATGSPTATLATKAIPPNTTTPTPATAIETPPSQVRATPSDGVKENDACSTGNNEAVPCTPTAPRMGGSVIPWTSAEEETLLGILRERGPRPLWKKVSELMCAAGHPRTARACRIRLAKIRGTGSRADGIVVRRAPEAESFWGKEEVNALRTVVESMTGEVRWKLVADQMLCEHNISRTVRSCRERYMRMYPESQLFKNAQGGSGTNVSTWSEREKKTLLDVLRTCTNTPVWEDVAQTLTLKGFERSATACRSFFHKWRARYRPGRSGMAEVFAESDDEDDDLADDENEAVDDDYMDIDENNAEEENDDTDQLKKTKTAGGADEEAEASGEKGSDGKDDVDMTSRLLSKFALHEAYSSEDEELRRRSPQRRRKRGGQTQQSSSGKKAESGAPPRRPWSVVRQLPRSGGADGMEVDGDSGDELELAALSGRLGGESGDDEARRGAKRSRMSTGAPWDDAENSLLLHLCARGLRAGGEPDWEKIAAVISEAGLPRDAGECREHAGEERMAAEIGVACGRKRYERGGVPLHGAADRFYDSLSEAGDSSISDISAAGAIGDIC